MQPVMNLPLLVPIVLNHHNSSALAPLPTLAYTPILAPVQLPALRFVVALTSVKKSSPHRMGEIVNLFAARISEPLIWAKTLAGTAENDVTYLAARMLLGE